MSGFILFGDENGHTQVPNVFLDEYMPEANGEYVKIYLYLLRMLGSDPQQLSISAIADRFDRTEGDVDRALKYWEKMHLLKLEYDESKTLTGVRMPGVAGFGGDGQEKEGNEPLTESALRQLIFVCEQYLGRPLSPVETEKLSNIHDSLGFSTELIEYLVEYCVNGGHRSMRYIEATASGWHESGITTVAEAREKAGSYGRASYMILKAFGITGRGPAVSETPFIDRWLKEERYDEALISEACGRTVRAIGNPSFPYADKILSTWKEAGVKDVSDLSAYDAARQDTTKIQGSESRGAKNAKSAPNRFHNFNEREYDYSQLEQALINKQ